MQLRIDVNGHLPVHVQLKEQLKFLITSGDLEPGTKLPTVRQLAGFLRINRNTVLRAYQELAQDGLIECRQGRGCIVQQLEETGQLVSTHLLEIVDDAIEQARELGVDPDDFAAIAYARARQRKIALPKRQLVFAECDVQVATDYARVIEERLNVEVIPVVLEDLKSPAPELVEQLAENSLVATTFFHVEEVRRLLYHSDVEVIGLTVKPHLETLIKVAAIPWGTPAVLVCVNEHSTRLLEKSLEDAGIKNVDVSVCGVDRPEDLAQILKKVSVVIASDHVAGQVRPLLQPDQRLIVLDYLALDQGAFRLLEAVLNQRTRCVPS